MGAKSRSRTYQRHQWCAGYAKVAALQKKPMFLMGLIFAAIGPKRKLSRRQRALEQIMNKPLKRIENAWKPNSKNAKKDEEPINI